MRYFFFTVFSVILINCSGLIDKPKNLVPEDKMSELIAEFALNEQIIPIAPNTDLESSTRFLLKQKKISATDFSESYKYYTSTGEIEKILSNSQKIILNKDASAKKYIEGKIKEQQVEENQELENPQKVEN